MPKFSLEELVALARQASKSSGGFSLETQRGRELAETYKKLGPKTLYRHEGYEATLQPVSSQLQAPNTDMSPTEPLGLYFGNRVQDLPALINPEVRSEARALERTSFRGAREAAEELASPLTYQVQDRGVSTFKSTGGIDSEEFIRARLTPDARVLDASDPEVWNRTLDRFSQEALSSTEQRFFDLSRRRISDKSITGAEHRELFDDMQLYTRTTKDTQAKLTNWLKDQYDAVTFPDIVAHQPNVTQTTLLNRGKAIGRQGNYYRLLSAAGLAGAGVLARGEADEAEASPIGTLLRSSSRAAKKALKSDLSSASAKLIGKRFKGGTIQKVTQGAGDWRNIIMEDGSVYPATKDVVSSLVRQHGTKEYLSAFAEKETEGQLSQALKSLAYHEARIPVGLDKKAIKETYRDYVRHYREAGIKSEPYSLIEYNGKLFSLPTTYADLLEKEGHVVVLERTVNPGGYRKKPTDPEGKW